MKVLIGFFSLFISSSVFADIYVCNFTEPFVTTVFDTKLSSLQYQDFQGSSTYKDIFVRNVDSITFEILTSDMRLLQRVIHNNQGSDGMSDEVYPFEAQDFSKIMTSGTAYGGCRLAP